MKLVLKALLMVILIISFTISAHAQEKLWNELSSKLVKLYQQGQYAEAAKIAEEALTVAEETFGTNHPSVGVSMLTLGRIYKAQGKYADAEPLYKRSLKIMEKALGPEHPNLAVVCENFGKLYSQIGKEDEAEKLEARARKIRSRQ